jgi:hypothetical protein
VSVSSRPKRIQRQSHGELLAPIHKLLGERRYKLKADKTVPQPRKRWRPRSKRGQGMKTSVKKNTIIPQPRKTDVFQGIHTHFTRDFARKLPRFSSCAPEMKIALSRRIDYALAASALRAFARLRARACGPCGVPAGRR